MMPKVELIAEFIKKKLKIYFVDPMENSGQYSFEISNGCVHPRNDVMGGTPPHPSQATQRVGLGLDVTVKVSGSMQDSPMNQTFKTQTLGMATTQSEHGSSLMMRLRL